MSDFVKRLRDNLCLVIKGKEPEVELLIAAFLGGGNILLTDVPGVISEDASTCNRRIDWAELVRNRQSNSGP